MEKHFPTEFETKSPPSFQPQPLSPSPQNLPYNEISTFQPLPTRSRPCGMRVPIHTVVLVVAIIILESTALFIYTIIGLIKSTPYSALMVSSPPICQCIQQEVPVPALSPLACNTDILAQQSVEYVTSTVLQTVTMTQLVGLTGNVRSTPPSTRVATFLAAPSLVTSIIYSTTVLGASTLEPRPTIFTTVVLPSPDTVGGSTT